jgi:cell division protein FtsW
MGIFFMIITLNVGCRYFKIATPFLLIVSIATLLWVIIAGQSTNGAQRWISILGIQFQPSEIAKGTLVLATAQILSAMQTPTGADRNAFKYILIVSGIIIPLIMFENLSTAVLLAGVIFFMMIIGRVPTQQLGKLMGIAVLGIVFIFAMVMIIGTDTGNVKKENNLTERTHEAKEDKGYKVFHRFDTWKSRIMKYANNKDLRPEDIDLDKDAQTAHANIAIASSNVVGKGPGNSVERDFLSQAFSDFIYAIIIEGLGFPGAFIVLSLYLILMYRSMRIAQKCKALFPSYLVMGLALMIVVQAMMNMAVAVGAFPVTGQPLPLVSRGGTSLFITCTYIGMILSVSHTAKRKPEYENKQLQAAEA